MVMNGDTDDTTPLIALGERLKTAREAKKWTVAKLSEKTRVSARHIENIERGDFHKIPGRAFIIGFTKTICLALNIKSEEILATIRTELYANKELHWQQLVETKQRRFFSFISSFRRSD